MNKVLSQVTSPASGAGSGGGRARAFLILLGIGLLVLLGLSIVLDSWYTIDQRERGVILRNGKLIGTALPGLGFKIPFIDTIVKISLETQRVQFDKVNSYSRDQQPADLSLAHGVSGAGGFAAEAALASQDRVDGAHGSRESCDGVTGE